MLSNATMKSIMDNKEICTMSIVNLKDYTQKLTINIEHSYYMIYVSDRNNDTLFTIDKDIRQIEYNISNENIEKYSPIINDFIRYLTPKGYDVMVYSYNTIKGFIEGTDVIDIKEVGKHGITEDFETNEQDSASDLDLEISEDEINRMMDEYFKPSQD